MFSVEFCGGADSTGQTGSDSRGSGLKSGWNSANRFVCMNSLNVAPSFPASNVSQFVGAVQPNDGGALVGVRSQTAEAKSLACGSANSVGSSSATSSLAAFASCSCGTFVTMRGTICFLVPKIKMNATCAARTKAIKKIQRCRDQPSPGSSGPASPDEVSAGAGFIV